MMSTIWKIICLMTIAEHQFLVEGRTVPLAIIRRAGTKRMNLRIDAAAGSIRLTLPRFAPVGPALRWVEEKRPWIEGQLARLPASQPIIPGMMISLGGQNIQLDWSQSYLRRPERKGDRLCIGGPLETLGPRLLRWLRQQALLKLREESEAVASRAHISIAGVGVGDPTSRWGSCSSTGQIRYSWRLILAPDFVLRATVAHEVAHRIHMDHSRAFHSLTAELLGADPKPARLWLKQNGPLLHGFGRSY